MIDLPNIDNEIEDEATGAIINVKSWRKLTREEVIAEVQLQILARGHKLKKGHRIEIYSHR